MAVGRGRAATKALSQVQCGRPAASGRSHYERECLHIDVQAKLAAMTLPSSGALIFCKDSTESMEPWDRYIVGPSTDKAFYSARCSNLDIARGPWSTSTRYLRAIANRELACLKQDDESLPHLKPGFVVPGSHDAYLSQKDPSEHIRLYQHVRAIAPHLRLKDDLMLPALHYWDSRAPNIFSSNGRLSSIIDWQGVQILPLGYYVAPPKLIDFDGELQLELPDHFDSIEDEDERTGIKKYVDSSKLLQRYFVSTRDSNPACDGVFEQSQALMMQHLVGYCDNSWEKGIAPLRQCLMTIQRSWSSIMADDIACPIDFTEDERSRYADESLGYQENRVFWEELRGYVSEDGSVSPENYDDALELFRGYREKYLLRVSGEQKEAFELQTAWAICA